MSIPAGLVSPMKNHETMPINVIFLGKKRRSVQKPIGVTINRIRAVEGLHRPHGPLDHAVMASKRLQEEDGSPARTRTWVQRNLRQRTMIAL